MMRRLVLFTILALGSGLAWATPRELLRLKTMAAETIGGGKPVVLLQERRHLSVLGTDDGAFAVIATSDALPPRMLAVADGGMNPGVEWWLQAMDEVLDNQPDVAKASVVPAQEVQPLLTTKWGQGAPFNNLCPTGADGTHCLTGCVATSTAQVLNYHKLPVRGRGQETVYYPFGDVTGQSVTAHFGATWFDFRHMLNDYQSVDYTEEEALAVATLMRATGVSANMAYGTDSEGGSGAVSAYACEALGRNFGFTDARYMHRADYGEEEWMQTIFDQLVTDNPIVYNGTDNVGGHSFVIDGCRADGLVHVNWGYEGHGDGYFDVATLRPGFSNGGYASQQGMMLFSGDPVRRATYADESLDTADFSAETFADGIVPAHLLRGHQYATRLVLPAGIKGWSEGVLTEGCSLREVVLPALDQEATCAVIDGAIYSADDSRLVALLPSTVGRANIAAGVTEVCPQAFAGCWGLDTLDLPATLLSIGTDALAGCGGLRLLRSRAKTPPTLQGYDTFTDIPIDRCVLSVPSGTKTTYSRRAQWKDFHEIVEFGTTVRASNAVRKQGEENPEFGYTISGDKVAGTPELYTDATIYSPPGVYTIYVLPGTITAPDVEYVNGRLIVEETSDIITVPTQAIPTAVYSLEGVLLTRLLNAAEDLKPGVYIVGGRKIVVGRR